MKLVDDVGPETGSGQKWYVKDGAIDDKVAFQVEGEAFPRIEIDPSAYGLIRVGDGQVPPVDRNSAAVNLGTLTAHGHSWIASSQSNGQDLFDFPRQSVLARLCGQLGVADDDLVDIAVAGSSATRATGVFGATVSGWAAVCQFMVPTNSNLVSGAGVTAAGGGLVTDLHDPPPGGSLMVHSVNDAGLIALFAPAALARAGAAYALAVKHFISRARAGVMWGSTAVAAVTTPAITWDAIFTFTGTWTNAPTLTAVMAPSPNVGAYGTGAATRSTSTNADILDTKTPDVLPDEGVFVLEFISTPGATGRLPAGGVSAAATSWVGMDDPNQEFPQAGGFSAQVDTEVVLVTATTGGATPTWTVTRDRAGSVGGAVLHDARADCWRYQASDLLVTEAFGRTLGGVVVSQGVSTQGQGLRGSSTPILVRVPLVPGDEQKFVRCTVRNLTGAQDKVTFSCAYIENQMCPPPVVIADLPRACTSNPKIYKVAPYFNDAVIAVVAEFGASDAIAIADLDARTIGRSAELTADITSGALTMNVTALSRDFQTRPNWIGSIGLERVRVTAVTGTYPNYTLTMERGAQGTSAAAHTRLEPATGSAAGLQTIISAGDIWADDNLHPSVGGAPLFAQAMFDAFTRCRIRSPKTHPGHALAASKSIQSIRDREPGVGNNFVIKPQMTAAMVVGTPVLNRMTAHLIKIPRLLWIDGMQVWHEAAGTPTTIRLGIYDMDATGARPGTLLFEYGQIGPAAGTLLKMRGHRLIRPGLYWAAFVQQGGTAASVGCFGAGGTALPLTDALDIASATDSPLVGVGQTGITGALPTGFPNTAIPVIGGATAANTIPVIGLNVKKNNWI